MALRSCLRDALFVRLVIILRVVFTLTLAINNCFFSFLNRLLLIFLLRNRLINLELRFFLVFNRLRFRRAKKLFLVGFFCFWAIFLTGCFFFAGGTTITAFFAALAASACAFSFLLVIFFLAAFFCAALTIFTVFALACYFFGETFLALTSSGNGSFLRLIATGFGVFFTTGFGCATTFALGCAFLLLATCLVTFTTLAAKVFALALVCACGCFLTACFEAFTGFCA